MKKTTIKDYKDAFIRFSETTLNEFEIKEYWKDGPMLAKLKGNIYKIYSHDDMYNHFKDSLTDIDMAMHIPPNYWIDVAEGVHNESSFINNLVQELNNKEHFEQLNLALNISSYAGNSPSIFWNTLHALSDTEVYPKAILVASEIYDINSMISELMEDMLIDGGNTFTEMQNGVFETIYLYEDTDKESVFYIYTADTGIWDV